MKKYPNRKVGDSFQILPTRKATNKNRNPPTGRLGIGSDPAYNVYPPSKNL
jgi:hypothetical protein